MQPRNTAFIRNLLYDLKFRYGAKVIIHRDAESLDLDTGIRTVTTSTVTVPKAIILPETLDRQFISRLSNIVANREFQYGGWFDTGVRLFLFQAADLGTWVPQDEDYMVFETRRWEITKIARFEFNMGFVITGQQAKGPKPFAIRHESARNRLLFSDSVTHELQ